MKFHHVPSVIAAVAAVVIYATSLYAADVKAGDLQISAAWVRATPKGASVGGGYLTIANAGAAADRLIGGASDASARFEIHEMSMDGGVMRMRALPNGLEIKSGQKIELRPGGNHVMFVGLTRSLEPGQQVKVMLTFEKAGKVEVEFPVQPIGAQNMHGGKGQMQHGH